MPETQDESDRATHLQLLECIGLFGQLWPKADGAASSKWCLQNPERQSDDGSVGTNTGVLLLFGRSFGRLDRHLHRAWLPGYLGNNGVQPHREEVRFTGGYKRSDQTLASLGNTEATVSLEFLVAPMPSRERMSADPACVTCVEALDICGRFDPRVPRKVATGVFQKLAE
jgi:hypothetical protein